MKIETHKIDGRLTVELPIHAKLITAQVIDTQTELVFYSPDSNETVVRHFLFVHKNDEHLELDGALQHRITITGPKSLRFHIFERV